MDPVLRRYLSSLASAGVRRIPVGQARASATAPAQRDEGQGAPTSGTRTAAAPSGGPGPGAQGHEAQAALDAVAAEVRSCQACKLCQQRNQAVPGEGSPRASIVFVGEGPGADEDRSGRPFVGPAGQLLEDIITKGMGLTRPDVFICNVVKCRPPGNRVPEPDESGACRGFLDRQLAAIAPRVICTLGATASQLLLQTDLSIGRLRGRSHRYGEIPVIPTYHPAYLLRTPSAKRATWEDIQQVMKIGLPL